MSLRVSSLTRLLALSLATVMIVAALACSGGADPTATTAPTATSPAPTATTAPASTDSGSVSEATAVPDVAEVPAAWIDRYLQSPGYKAEWGEPKTGGIFKYGGSHATTVHTPNVGHGFSGPQFLPTYNALLRVDPWVGLGTVQGDLAKSWELSADGLTLSFVLHEGVKFQSNPNLPEHVQALVSGDELTCEDTKASLEFGINPNPETTIRKDPGIQLYYVDNITCPDGPLGYTMEINFTMALAKTMAVFAGGEGMSHNMDKDFIHWLDTECQKCLDATDSTTFLYGTGTGAFVPTEYQADVINKLRRNPTYFREGLPLLDGMDQFVLKDFTTRFTALVTGQIHYFGEGSASLLPGQVEQVERDFSDRVTLGPVMHSWGKGIEFNMGRAPFDDQRVRQAFHLMLDRDEWAAFNEAGSTAGVKHAAWMPPGTFWAFSDEELLALPGWRQPKDEDIAEANRLLDEALGAGERFEAVCSVSNSQMYIDGCLFLQDQVKKNLGMQMTLDIGEGAVNSEKYKAGNYQMKYGSAQETSVGDPDDHYYEEIIYEYLSTSDKYAYTAVLDTPEYVKLQADIVAQSAELDPVKRQQMNYQLELDQLELSYAMPYAWTIIFPGWTKAVRGWNQFDFGSQSKWTQWERVWLAE